MDPATLSLIAALVREVGIPAVRAIAAAVRGDGHLETADALDAAAAAALSRADATHDTVIARARQEQGHDRNGVYPPPYGDS